MAHAAALLPLADETLGTVFLPLVAAPSPRLSFISPENSAYSLS